MVMSQGVDAAVEVAKKYYGFIGLCHRLSTRPHCPRQVKYGAPDHYQNLIEVGGSSRLKPVLATGNVHYLEPEDEIYQEIIVNSLGQGYD